MQVIRFAAKRHIALRSRLSPSDAPPGNGFKHRDRTSESIVTREDKEFMTMFGIVLGILMLLAVIFFVIARFTAIATHDPFDPTAAGYQQMQERIAPEGKVNLSTVPDEAAGGGPEQQQTAAASVDEETTAGDGGGDEGDEGAANGQDVYSQVCAACHDTGVAGAPALGDEEAWAPRLEKGKEALYDSAINGLGAMPPKGGKPDLSDEEVQAAVDYMIEEVK